MIAGLGIALSAGMGTKHLHAQELTLAEQTPLLSQLTPVERDVTEETLRYGAELALSNWDALRNDALKRSFDSYFEIFREVARIESVSRATQIAGVDTRSAISVVARELHLKMNAKGLTASGAGMEALRTLVANPVESYAKDDPDSFKVRYTLILDYLTGMDAARLSIALSKKLTDAGLQALALEIYVDFLPLYYQGLSTPQDRLELMELASQAAGSASDPAVMRVLTDLLRASPRSEKLTLAQASLKHFDIAALRAARDTAGGAGRLVLTAWIAGAATVQGKTVDLDLDGLRDEAQGSLDSRAFELLMLSVADDVERNRLIAAAVTADIAEGRPILAYDRATNLSLLPQMAADTYLALIHSFSEAGYTNYVHRLAQLVADAAKAGQIRLTQDQMTRFFGDLEIIRAPVFIAALADAMPSSDVIARRAALRANIKALFSMPVDKPLAGLSIDSGSETTKALQVAVDLIGARNSDPASLDTHAPSSASDMTLLSDVATRLWHYADHRDALSAFITGAADADLRRAVALGVTAFSGFQVDEAAHAGLAEALAELATGAEANGQNLLSASVGQVAEPLKLRGEALGRYARHAAAAGQAVFLPADADDTDRAAVEEAQAVFGNIDVATERLKTIVDYRTRVKAWRRLAEARASVLDGKGWLNTATAPAGSSPNILAFDDTSAASDGRVALSLPTASASFTAKRPFMPNLLLGAEAVTSRIPVPPLRETNEALADISMRGETRATRLIRFSSEHFDEIINLGVREYLYLNSESTVPRIIFVTRGVLTMSDLIAQVTANDPDAITLEGGVVTLNVPLAVNDGAELIVSGREIDALRLNTKAGAFIVNSGKIYFDDVVVSSLDEETGKPSYIENHEKGIFFRPFILSWSGSETFASGSHFVALGYAGGRTYGMSLSSGSTDTSARKVQAAAPTGTFINNSFDNLYYGFYAFEANDIVFVGNELVDGVIYGLDPHDRSKNLMMAYNTAYATQKKHGIIISREVDDSFIIGNLSFENHGSGIMLDRLSYGTVVYANDASRNDGDGFSAMESPCALVDSNMFYSNGRAGVKVRNSWDVHVEANRILRNKSVGIEAYIDNLTRAEQSEFRDFKEDPYFPIASVAATGNVLEGNRVGVMTRGASAALLQANRFIDQLPRYVSGDLKPLGGDVVTGNMTSGVMVRAVCVPKIPADKACSLAKSGVIVAQSLGPAFSAQETAANQCVDVAGSVQSDAFNPQQGE